MAFSGDGGYEAASQRVGQVLRGKYRIDRVIGVGGMAAVYAATHRNQKQFAIKLLHPEISHREEIRTRFLREGYAANSVRHPGTVAVLDDDVTEDGAAFLVMELLEGKSLEDLAESLGGRLPEPTVLAVAHALLDTLGAAHGQGIVHRDIKPANIFLTRDGQVKVLDFGIARVRDAATSSASATGTGILLGTPSFMAPEQALGKPGEVDASTDVWAAAATMFTLITGRPVHEGESASHAVILAATAAARPIASLAPGLPGPIAAVVDRGLSFQKGNRWTSAFAMRDAVRDAATQVLGRWPLADALQTPFGAAVDPLGQTRAASPPMTPLPASLASQPSAPWQGSQAGALGAPIAPPTAAPATPYPGALGPGTSQGIAYEPGPPSLPPGVTGSRRAGIVVGAVVAGAVVVVGAVLALRSGGSSSATDVPPGASAPLSAGQSSAAGVVVAAAPAAPVVLAPEPPALQASAPSSARAVEPAAPGQSAAPARPRPLPSAQGQAAVAATPAAAPPSTAGAAPQCRLVSYFDGDGNKHFNKECR